MPTAVADGIVTRYEVTGHGPPLLMFSPGGFDSTLEGWGTVGVYKQLDLLAQLSQNYTCITYDRRESGRSGARVEQVRWSDYVAQGLGLLDHLDIGSAHLMGGCVGCSTAVATAVAQPERVRSMVLYSPAGGAKYRMRQHQRFARHLAFVDEHGLDGVVALAMNGEESFTADPRLGPWVSAIRNSREFAELYANTDVFRYRVIVSGLARRMFDRDTVPGAEPEDLMVCEVPTLIVPGQDESHAPSAARYLQECLPVSEYWDVPVAEQTAKTAPARILAFLDHH